MAGIDSVALREAAEYFLEIIGTDGIVSESDGDESVYKYVILTAEEFGVSPMKMRKMSNTAGADRVELCRRRQRAITRLQMNPSEETLWDCIVEHQNYLFHTMSGLPYEYQLKIGKDGQYTRELIVDRREASKTLTWSSVKLAYKNALAYEGVVPRPKALGDIRGISYIYPMLGRFGVIEVAKR